MVSMTELAMCLRNKRRTNHRAFVTDHFCAETGAFQSFRHCQQNLPALRHGVDCHTFLPARPERIVRFTRRTIRVRTYAQSDVGNVLQRRNVGDLNTFRFPVLDDIRNVLSKGGNAIDFEVSATVFPVRSESSRLETPRKAVLCLFCKRKGVPHY